MILEGGGQFKEITMKLTDAQFLELKRFRIEDVCRIFRVLLHLVQDLTRSTNNNIEHQSLEFIVYSKHKGKDINACINSYDGDVYTASRIYTALKEHKGKVKVKIDGVVISAASVIAMSGDEILMSPTSICMIHNPWEIFKVKLKI
ncbi:Clp protease ClpP [Clostridium kluyveri]|uniref:Clp protease n=1 Tax=Clostridium kluyveri TaxID=1534 RepID=A0A1L5FA64_CLOKL|nr:phage portal protein [Clostridium kluyveri]APM39857.1 hypothetical protein BS101_14515 [Clostridium kluyveri]